MKNDLKKFISTGQPVEQENFYRLTCRNFQILQADLADHLMQCEMIMISPAVLIDFSVGWAADLGIGHGKSLQSDL